MTQHLATPPQSLRERVPALSPAIEEAVLRALAKEPGQRFSSVQDFATALQRAAQGTTSLPTTLLSIPVPGAASPGSIPAPTVSAVQGQASAGKIAYVWQEPARPAALVGRAAEWAQLVAAWQSASAGRPQMLVLSGEAGIGKTSLAEALLGEVRRQGLATAVAHCYAVEEELAYSPVLNWLQAEALRPALPELDPIWLTELARLLPDLLLERPELPPPGPLKDDWQRQRLLEALARALLCTHSPLLLLLDDLQWCDRETLAWLHYLLRYDPHAPLLIMCTQRLGERSTNPQLESLLVSLRRAGQVSEIALASLDAAETAVLAGHIAGRSLSPTLAAHLYRESEGNPLFVVETMRMGAGMEQELQGAEQPSGEPASPFHRALSSPTIQGIIAARLEQCSPSARELINVAAVIGRAFTFEMLKQVSGVDEDALIQFLDEMWERRLIREQGADSYDFSHNKLREGAYTALSRAKRRLLHRRVADALERLSGASSDGSTSHLADLAYHFYEAGAWEKAVAYGQRAAEQAYRLYALQAAIEQVTRGLNAAQRGSIAAPASLHHLRGQAYETLGDFERARLDFEATLHQARAASDRQGEWQALMDLGFLWAQRDYSRTGTYYQQALALARDMHDPLTLAHSLNRVGNWHLNTEQPQQALRSHQEALALFQQAQDQHGLAETYDLLGMTSFIGADLASGTSYYQRAVALFQQLDDRQGLTSSLIMLGATAGGYQTDTLVPTPLSYVETLHFSEQALKIAREVGQRSAEAFALLLLAHYLGPRGEYGRALEAVQASLALAGQIQHRQWMTFGYWVEGALYLDLLALPEARQSLEQALALAREIGSLHWIRIVSGFLARAYLLQHDLASADAVLAAALEPDATMQTVGQRLVWEARAELALARHDQPSALDIVERLIASAANLSSERVIPGLWKLRAGSLAALGRSEEAEAMLRAAQEAARTQGLRSMLWRIDAALGKLYETRARREEAEQVLVSARTLIDELAASVPDKRLREQFLRLAMAQTETGMSEDISTS